MVVLGELLARVDEAVVTGPQGIPIGPQEGDQVDAPDHPLVPPGPVVADQTHVPGERLVEHRVVEDQDAIVFADEGFGLLPEGFGVGFESVEESGVGVVGGCVGSGWCHATGLRGGVDLGRRHKIWM